MENVRLECLRLAIANDRTGDPAEVLEAAKRYEAWVDGREAGAPAPSPEAG